MALPYTAADITELQSQCSAMATIFSNLQVAFLQAGTHTDWAGARLHILDAAGLCTQAYDMWKTTGLINFNSQLIKMATGVRNNWPVLGAPPTMANILTAMLLAKYDELTQFVGIEDAYRSAIWEQPFNAEFYAALARGFRP